MIEERPVVSVLMGVYYQRESIGLLHRAVDSILMQSFANFEFLICDGGSSKEARSFLDQIAKNDSRVHLIRDKALPTDLASKLNACLRYAKGDFIARMDDDDVSYPGRFEQQVRYLNSHPDIAFVGCNVVLQTEHTKVGCRMLPEYPQVKDFYFTQPFIHPTLMFRREALFAVKGYSESKYQVLCEDYDLLLRLYTNGYYGANLQENLFEYTVPISASGNRKMKHRWNETVTRWCRFKELQLLPKALPYVIKPLAVGLIPSCLLKRIKENSQCQI